MKASTTGLQRFRAVWKYWLWLALVLLSCCLIVACQGDSASKSGQAQLRSDCRQIHHDLGQICVPPDPDAVITLEEITFADAIALGVSPIGTAIYEDVSIDYLKDTDSPPPASVGKRARFKTRLHFRCTHVE